MKKAKRILFLIVALGLVIYLITGIYYALYEPERSPDILWGIFHVHSTMSDGLAAPEEIAESAKDVGVSLVLLTDHGRPNVKASAYHEIFDGVHIVGGSEMSMPDGHLSFFGAHTVPLYKLPPYPPDAVADIHEWGGVAVVSYPNDPLYAWSYWEEDFHPDALELINISTCYRRLNVLEKALTAIYFPFSKYIFLKYLSYPGENLEKWDHLLQQGQVAGLPALNTHGGFHLNGSWFVPVPSYASLFSLIAMGMDKKYASDPLEAIRRGDFFTCVRGAGEPQQFLFYAMRGSVRYPSGSTVDGEASLHVFVDSDELITRILLKKDGQICQESTGDSINCSPAPPGVYRVEVFLPDHPLLPPNMPWIFSNPITITEEKLQSKREKTELISRYHPIKLSDFHVEKDDVSSGSFMHADGGSLFSYSLAKYADDGNNRWCALASRRERDLSEVEGFYISAWSDKNLRYFIELRSGDRWYYSSFKLDPDKVTTCLVPFHTFYRVMDGLETMPLSEIDSMFISQSNYTSQTGFSAQLRIEEMGFYTLANKSGAERK